MPSDADRISSGLVTFIKKTLGSLIISRIDYLAHYTCKVIAQNSDGTLELLADDTRVGTPSGVPIRYGIPGVTALVPVGSRCNLTFANGDPSQPIVVSWVPGTILKIVISSGVNGAARNGDSVSPTQDMITWMQQVSNYINGLSPGSVAPPSPLTFGAISSGSQKVTIG